MGALFAIFFQLIIVFIISCFIALVFSIISSFSKENKKRKIAFALISPFIFCFSLYFFALIGTGIVSEIKNTDSGIGDYWYVPLTKEVKLSFIDLPENSYLEINDKEQFTDVQKIAQIANDYYIKTNDKTYILKNNSNKIEETKLNKEPKFLSSWDFYIKKKNEVVGNLLIFVGIISLILSASLIYLLRKIIIKKNYS